MQMATVPHSILVTVTLPTTRSDGSAVVPSDISEVDILRATVATDGTVSPFAKLASVTTGISGPAVTFVDAAVAPGVSYEYEADCVDNQTPPLVGAVSSPTGAVAIPLALAALSAPTVAAVLQ